MSAIVAMRGMVYAALAVAATLIFLLWKTGRFQSKMSQLPIAVGDFEAQKRFLAAHKAFLFEYKELDALLKKVFIRTLKNLPEEQSTSKEWNSCDDIEMARVVVFYLGRIAADDFGELLTLAGNGRGIGAYKILRGMYERVVTAAFIANDAREARHFLIHSDIERWKLWKRTVEIQPDIKDRVPPEEIQGLEERYNEAQRGVKSELCKTCRQPITQEAWTRVTLDTMASKTDPNLHVAYAYCYLLPTFHLHATSFGIESRLRETEKGYSYKERSEYEARNAMLHGHGLTLRLLKLQNTYFKLGLDAEVEARWEMFPKVWGGKKEVGDGIA